MSNQKLSGVDLIAEERRKQIQKHGYDVTRDAESYEKSQLVLASVAYALPEQLPVPVGEHYTDREEWWPWDYKFYKPSPQNRIKELAKAGALIAAEIDRLNHLDNLAAKQKAEILKKYTIGASILVSAFPGTGKSYYVYNGNWSQYVPQGFATDSDSSRFPKEHFPQNYIEHIKQNIEQSYARIFISSHKEVRTALVSNNFPFVLIYPAVELKDEYIERYKQRGSSEQFITMISNNWEQWIADCRTQTGCHHIELKSGQYISNVI